MDEFNLNNFHRKFYGGCIGIEFEGDNYGVMFSSIPQHASSNQPMVGLSSAWTKKKDYQESITSSLNISTKKIPLREITILPLPQRQVFDSCGRTFLYSRRPERQWTKAIVNKNSKFGNPIFDMVAEFPRVPQIELKGFGSGISADIRYLHNLFTPNYADNIQEAIKEIEKFSLLSRTLSHMYFISKSPNSKYPYLLFRYNLPVAFYDNTQDKFTLLCSLFKQEIYDFCTRFRLNSEIQEIKT